MINTTTQNKGHQMPSLKYLKGKFLKRYNPTKTEAVALSKAISVSVQRNELYKTGFSTGQKNTIRDAWKTELQRLSTQYRRKVSERKHEENIKELANEMNSSFANLFRQDGFKISHAQKSLSVYLKHLWCMEKIPEPPQCPVDSEILKVALRKENVPSWTKITTITEHRKLISILKSAAGSESLSVWELKAFAGSSPSRTESHKPKSITPQPKGTTKMPITNITQARFNQKGFYVTREALDLLGDPDDGDTIRVFPGETTKASYEGKVTKVNKGSQALISCPALFSENFHTELPLPLQLNNKVRYNAGLGWIRLFEKL